MLSLDELKNMTLDELKKQVFKYLMEEIGFSDGAFNVPSESQLCLSLDSVADCYLDNVIELWLCDIDGQRVDDIVTLSIKDADLGDFMAKLMCLSATHSILHLGTREDNPGLLRIVMVDDKGRRNSNIDVQVMEKLVKVLFEKNV